MSQSRVQGVKFNNLDDANKVIQLQTLIIAAQNELYGVVMSYAKVIDALVKYPGHRGKIETIGDKILELEKAIGEIYEHGTWES